jgi:hypothetical protein
MPAEDRLPSFLGLAMTEESVKYPGQWFPNSHVVPTDLLKNDE